MSLKVAVWLILGLILGVGLVLCKGRIADEAHSRPPALWMDSLEAAQEQARASGKPLLIHVTGAG